MGAPRRGPRRPPRARSARGVAGRALIEVDQGAHADDVLDALLGATPGLSERDRAFAWFVALGVLRRQATVDAALAPRLSRALPQLDPEVRAALRIGAFELFYARTPRHAAVHSAVELARELGAGRASGMVNAVLRRVELPQNLPRATRLEHPAWLVARWDARFGEAAVDAWCALLQEPPPLTVVCRDAAARDALLADAEVDAIPATVDGEPVDGVVHVRGLRGAVTALPGFADGGLWVMDLASARVADLVPPGRVLDACAAPGGKTLRMASRGREVTAVDRSRARLDKVRHGARRTGLPVHTRAVDWLRGDVPDLGVFDAVLVDAPCTGLGTLRRHPEIRWRRSEADLMDAAARQVGIVTRAAAHVRPGGHLVYAVCSAEPEEGPAVIEELVAARPELELELELCTAPPGPDQDAFYAARLRSTR